MTYLDEVLAFGLGHERLELRGGEGVDKAGFRDDEEQDLGTSEDREFVCLHEPRRVRKWRWA